MKTKLSEKSTPSKRRKVNGSTPKSSKKTPKKSDSRSSATSQLLSDGAKWRLHPRLLEGLKKKGFDSFFPIQSAVIPILLESIRADDKLLGDVCIAAPTGSGKTLAYTVPIIQTLLQRRIVQLRALVVVPTKELAAQVFDVMSVLGDAFGLRTGAVYGGTTFEEEQSLIANGPASCIPPWKDAMEAMGLQSPPLQSGLDILIATPGRLVDHLDRTPSLNLRNLRFLVVDEADRLLSQQYQNWVHNVLSAVHSTAVPAPRTSETTDVKAGDFVMPSLGRYAVREKLSDAIDGFFSPLQGISHAQAAPAPHVRRLGNHAAVATVFSAHSATPPLRRILCSATLTDNPQKMFAVQLHRPVFFSAERGLDAANVHVQAVGSGASAVLSTSKYEAKDAAQTKQKLTAAVEEEKESKEEVAADVEEQEGSESSEAEATKPSKSGGLTEVAKLLKPQQKPSAAAHLKGTEVVKKRYQAPTGLQQEFMKCARAEKAAAVLWLLKSYIAKNQGAVFLIFCSSVETTHRLARMIQLSDAIDKTCIEFSASLSSKDRQKALKQVASGKAKIVVCSDAAARGIDLPQVDVVIQYDAPQRAKTYVHRIGRTARAGKAGTSCTLLDAQQHKRFEKIMSKIESDTVQEVKCDDLSAEMEAVRSCLEKTERVIIAEAQGQLKLTSSLKKIHQYLDSVKEEEEEEKESAE